MLDLQFDWIWEDWRVAVKVFLSAIVVGGLVAGAAWQSGGTRQVIISTWVAASIAALKERLSKKPADQVHDTQRKRALKAGADFPERRVTEIPQAPNREWPSGYR